MIALTDQTGQITSLDNHPTRIISVVPSQTELLYDLRLDQEVVGITKFCVHPEAWRHTKQITGGTKKLDIKKVKALNPDLVIANKEENSKNEILAISQFCPVYISDIKTLEDAFKMIVDIGELTNRRNESSEIADEIRRRFLQLPVPRVQRRAAYFIWKNPLMVAGGDTFINNMLAYAGFINVFSDVNRYPSISFGDLQELSPEVILLSSEPFPFQQKHVAEFRQHLPQSRILLVDGEIFSWYGSRLLQTPAYLSELAEMLR